MMQKIYPFKFLDSYQREDKDFFFGRDEEIEALYQMIFQTRILLIYGTSGTGKTSLIQCGLANKFQTYDWLALNIRRGGNLLSSFDKRLCEESDEVFTYVEEKDFVIKDLAAKIDAVYKASFKPVYLIFDQFEELYVLGNKVEQEHFILAVKEILSVEQPVKIILSIREEYLGYLYEFERAVPELLRKKLRVEPMNLEKVKTVIKNIGQSEQTIISLKAGEEDRIAEDIFDRIRGEEKTLSIQLPYLQVFLDKLYLKITRDETCKTEAVFTLDALQKIGNIGDVLRNFLDDQVSVTAKILNIKPDDIWKILSPFVTLEGTKEPLSAIQISERFPDEPAERIAAALQTFVDSRILRFTENEQLYEIAHDSLAKQINAKRSDEEIAILEVQRLIRSQVAVKAEAREYFTEKQLLFIEPYLEKFKESEEEEDWIFRSRAFIQAQKESLIKKQQEELRKTRKRLRIVRVLLAGSIIACIAAGLSWRNAHKAKEDLSKFLNTAIGAQYAGGIIFCRIGESTEHGLVAAENDFNSTYTWLEAKKLCEDYTITVDGVIYDDWRLPDKDEIVALYSNRKIVGGFLEGFYWTSSDSEEDAYRAWIQNFKEGSTQDELHKKEERYHVRAIRTFNNLSSGLTESR